MQQPDPAMKAFLMRATQDGNRVAHEIDGSELVKIRRSIEALRIGTFERDRMEVLYNLLFGEAF
jgi:hypothetical protein